MRDLSHGRPQHGAREITAHPMMFGDREEPEWQQQAIGGMAPAHKCFETREAPSADVHLRLVVVD